jgi:hypothetical protein
MIPSNLQTFFWDADLHTFDPKAYPDNTIYRVLELGGDGAVAWMRTTFSEAEIRRVLTTERRLSEE